MGEAPGGRGLRYDRTVARAIRLRRALGVVDRPWMRFPFWRQRAEFIPLWRIEGPLDDVFRPEARAVVQPERLAAVLRGWAPRWANDTRLHASEYLAIEMTMPGTLLPRAVLRLTEAMAMITETRERLDRTRPEG